MNSFGSIVRMPPNRILSRHRNSRPPALFPTKDWVCSPPSGGNTFKPFRSDELFRINRPDAAESYFKQAQKLAPASPLPYEGLGLLAAERGQHVEALRDLKDALQHGSTSF